MSYPILTNKQIVVLETLAAMSQGGCTYFLGWNVALRISWSSQDYQHWDPGINHNDMIAMERSVVGVLAYLERAGLVKSSLPELNNDNGLKGLKNWALSPLGHEVAGEAI